jgi:uncharacterized membrane protein YphA (DoxX/SURF4 family)
VVTALALLAINVGAWTMGHNAQVRAELLITGGFALIVWAGIGMLSLCLELKAWLAGIR